MESTATEMQHSVEQPSTAPRVEVFVSALGRSLQARTAAPGLTHSVVTLYYSFSKKKGEKNASSVMLDTGFQHANALRVEPLQTWHGQRKQLNNCGVV